MLKNAVPKAPLNGHHSYSSLAATGLCKLYVLVVLILLLGVRQAGAYEGWIGRIHYHSEYKAKSTYSTPQRSAYHIGASCSHSRVVDAHVKACFADGALVDARAKVDYDLTHKESCDWTQDHEICCGGVPAFAAIWEDRNKGCDRVTPGDKGKVEYDWRGVQVGDPEIKSVQLAVRERLGTYTLLLDGEFPVRWKMTHRGKAHLACSGEERSESPPIKISDLNEHFSFSADLKFSGDTIKNQITLVDIQDVPVGPFCFAAGCSVRGLGPILDASKEEKQRTMRTTARWHFKKTDCFGVISMAKGDVRIKPPAGAEEFPGSDWIGPEGWPAELGCVDAQEGMLIETGAKSRVKVMTEDTEICLGADSSAELSKLCAPAREPGLINLLRGVLLQIVSQDGEFKPIICNAVNGRRGQAPRDKGTTVAHALLDILASPAQAQEAEDPSLVTEEDLAMAKLAVMVERRPGLLDVQVLKGNTVVEYGGAMLRLGPGEHFTKRWVLPADAAAHKQVMIRADEDIEEAQDTPTPASPCEMLKHSRAQLEEAIAHCEAAARQDASQTSQCELLKQQVKQLDMAIEQLCQ
ncbi:MAG: hypothetical protein JSW12_17335 [Deltaproteobacteria bacterium]|nr:MAG: hypothetical protein JSW12_17335 [Deltaproteobacteria bacterium]